MNKRLGVPLTVVACLVAAALWGHALAAPEDVVAGDIRAVLGKRGTPVRERPSALSRATATLPHATRVRVAEVRGAWIRVTALGPAAAASQAGWLRANHTVEPFALTQAGRGGSVAVRDAQTSGTDLSAAGRQFDESTEQAYRQSRTDLRAFYPLVDAIESTTPDSGTVRRFILAGRLGRPEGRSEGGAE